MQILKTHGLMAAMTGLAVTAGYVPAAYAHVDGTMHHHNGYDDPVFMVASLTTLAIVGVAAAWRYFRNDR